MAAGRTGKRLTARALAAAGTLLLLLTLPAQGSSRPDFEYQCRLPGLPSAYNVADEGKKPAVRSQGGLETCWAISAVSAVESALLPEDPVTLSPEHMSLRNGFTTTQADGGDYFMIMSYLADWKGPVLEEEDPYGDGFSPEGLAPALHVQEMRILRGMGRRQIKQMILTYGAVQTSLTMDRSYTDSDRLHYYRADTCAYRDPIIEELNHDVLVLGWDDAYPRENFGIVPKRDGAWICQNTWGEDFGQDGIFYVSYEDANLFRKGGVAYTDIDTGMEDDPPAVPGNADGLGKAGSESSPAQIEFRYDSVLENDTLGWQGRQGFGRSSCWMAGAFTSDRAQALSAVGFYATGPYTSYRVYVIPELEEGENPAGKERMIAAAGQAPNPGYYTVELPGEILLRAGQRFAVCVWIDTRGADKSAAVEFSRDRYTQSVTLEGRETWLSEDGESWQQTQTRYGTNVCLKAYLSTDKGLR